MDVAAIVGQLGVAVAHSRNDLLPVVACCDDVPKAR
jgi:hypothetical protein